MSDKKLYLDINKVRDLYKKKNKKVKYVSQSNLQEVAEGMTRQTLSNYIGSKGLPPSFRWLKNIADDLGVKIDDIITDKK